MKKLFLFIITVIVFCLGIYLVQQRHKPELSTVTAPAKAVKADKEVSESQNGRKGKGEGVTIQNGSNKSNACVYMKGIRRYNDRFDKEPKKVLFFYHGGGERIDNDKHKENIRAVISHLDFVPNNENIVNLVFETGIAETHGGYWVKSTYNNADMGVYQINIHTYKDLMAWLKRHNLDKQIMKFYDRKQTLVYNLVHNAAFNASLCIAHYYRCYGDDLSAVADTIDNRARMWKHRYNTKLGKGTVEDYLERVEIYG